MLTIPVGSMADVPKDLLQEIKRLEELFTVDTAKLNFLQGRGEKVPKGATLTKTKYITKKLVKA